MWYAILCPVQCVHRADCTKSQNAFTLLWQTTLCALQPVIVCIFHCVDKLLPYKFNLSWFYSSISPHSRFHSLIKRKTDMFKFEKRTTYVYTYTYRIYSFGMPFWKIFIAKMITFFLTNSCYYFVLLLTFL